MKSTFQLLIAAAVFFGTSLLGIAAEDLKTPAIAYFEAASKGQTEAMAKLYADLPARSAEKVLEEFASMVRHVEKSNKKEVIDLQKVDGDLGVVTFRDKPADPDPIYMQKQQGSWKILSAGDYIPSELGLDEARLTRLDALKAWFKQEKQNLRQKRNK